MLNKVSLIGNLGKDPETKYTASGLAICSFSLATTEKIKGEATTEWHKIVSFGKLAEICGEYLTKGKQVYIEGKIQTREWEDKNGVKRSTTEIVANEMRMLGSRGDGERPAQRQSKPQGNSYEPPVPEDDDIPF
jgi:single-strand DNA-binding protein